jgi:hypothetical protein
VNPKATAPASRSPSAPWVVGILVVFVSLATLYNVLNPILEAPDEIQHVYYVHWLANGQGLPVQGEEGKGRWEQEGSQPPLYYVTAALLTSWIDSTDLDERVWLNPHANVGVPLEPHNKNRVIHTDAEAFPYRGATLLIHLSRFLSTLMGAGTVLATYCLVRVVFPDRPRLAMAAMGLVALLPQFLFLSSAVNNDNAVILFSGWTLVVLARWLKAPGLPSLRQGALLGLLLGLAALSKLSGLGLWILAGLVWVGLMARHRMPTKGIQLAGVMVGVGGLIAGWWYLRNVLLYGDLTGLNAMFAVVGRRREGVGLRELWAEFEGLRISSWALFGWFNVPLPRWLYRLGDTVSGLAGVGLGIWFLRSAPRRPRRRVAVLVMLLAWIALVLAGLLQWTRMTPGTQGRLLFPALPALALVFVLGASTLLPRRVRGPVGWLAGGAWLVFALLMPLLVIVPAYARPEIVSSADLPPNLSALDVVYRGRIRLLGYRLDDTPRQPSDRIPITLYWQGLNDMEEDYSLYLHLTGREGRVIGQVDTYPGRGTYPTSLWTPGQIIADRYLVPIDPAAAVPTLGWVDLGWYVLDTYERLEAVDPRGQPVETVLAGPVKIEPTLWPSPMAEHPTNIRLGDHIALQGFTLLPSGLRRGGEIQLTLHWHALAPIAEDYTVFVHLLDGEGTIQAQTDEQPLGGDYPTSYWSPGEVVQDPILIGLGADLPPGDYRLVLGMYHVGTDTRLPVSGPELPDSTRDWVELAKVRIR